MKVVLQLTPLEMNFVMVTLESKLEELRDVEFDLTFECDCGRPLSETMNSVSKRIELGEKILDNLKTIDRSYEISK